MEVAADRLRPPARRRQRRCAVPVDRADDSRHGARRHPVAARRRGPGGRIRPAGKRFDAPGAAGPAPSGAPRPVRAPRAAAGHRAGPLVSHRAGPGAVRRRRRPHLHPAGPSADRLAGPAVFGQRAPVRLAGRRRGIGLDHPGPGRRPARARRRRRHRRHGQRPARHPGRRHRHARPDPRRGAAALRRADAGAHRAVLPPLPAGLLGVQGRLRRRGRHPVDQPALRPGRQRAPGRELRRDRRHRTPTRAGQAGAAPVRPGGTAIPGRPVPLGRRHQPDLGLRARAVRLHRRRHRPRRRPDRAVRARIPRPRRRHRQQGHRRPGRLQRQLHRRRYPPAAPTTGCRSSCGRASRSPRTPPACPVSICVRSPRRRDRASTGCVAITPPRPRWPGCAAAAASLRRLWPRSPGRYRSGNRPRH